MFTTCGHFVFGEQHTQCPWYAWGEGGGIILLHCCAVASQGGGSWGGGSTILRHKDRHGCPTDHATSVPRTWTAPWAVPWIYSYVLTQTAPQVRHGPMTMPPARGALYGDRVCNVVDGATFDCLKPTLAIWLLKLLPALGLRLCVTPNFPSTSWEPIT